jgi:hypothetical protein
VRNRNNIILAALIMVVSNLSFARDCQIVLSLSGPMEVYQEDIVDILSRKDFEVRVLRSWQEGKNEKHLSSIGLTSAGSMQFKQWQRIQLITTKGIQIADHSIEVGLFSNKERAVLSFLRNEVSTCR